MSQKNAKSGTFETFGTWDQGSRCFMKHSTLENFQNRPGPTGSMAEAGMGRTIGRRKWGAMGRARQSNAPDDCPQMIRFSMKRSKSASGILRRATGSRVDGRHGGVLLLLIAPAPISACASACPAYARRDRRACG